MGTLTTTTAARSTAFGNQRKVGATSLGVRWAAAAQAADGTASATHVVGYSTDNGATWSKTAIPMPSGSAGSYTPDSDLVVDANDRVHHVLTDTGTGWTYYRWASLDSTHTVPTWSAWTRIDNAEYHSAPSLAVHPDPTVAGAVYVHVVASYVTFSTTNYMRYRRGYLTAAGSLSWDSGFITVGGSYDAQVDVFPSIDFRHTGDGKTVSGGQPDLFVSWTAGRAGAGYGIRLRKATYSGGSWTFGTEVSVDTAHYVAGSANINRVDSNSWVSSFWDGTRVVIAGLMSTGSGLDLILHDVNPDTSAVTQRILGSQSPGNLFDFGWGSAAYDAVGNVYLFGTESSAGAGSRVLGYRKWTRSGATLAAKVTLASTGGSTPWAITGRGAPGGRIDWLSTQGSASPFTVTTGQVVLNYPPNTATASSPTGNTSVDRTQPTPLVWVFSDPDSGDSQSRADVRYRVGTGAFTTITNAATTATTYSIPANTFTAGQQVGWQVLVYDAQGTPAGAWSSEAFFTAAEATPTPVITAPAVDSTIGASTYSVQWSSSAQDAYQLRRLANNAGSPADPAVPANVYYDTGVVEDATARSRTVTFETNNRVEHVQVRTRKGSLFSMWATARATVSFTPPATPTLVLTAVKTKPEFTGTDAIDVAITNPAPAGGQPTVVSHDVLVDDGNSEGLRRVATGLMPGVTWRHTTPAGGRDYQLGRIRVVAVAANGTTSTASS